MGLIHSTYMVNKDLVLFLDSANVKSYPGSNTVWTDLSGNGNHGTLNSGVGYSANNMGYLTFDGTDDYVDCGNNASLDVNNNITASAWFYVNSVGSYQAILGKVTSGYTLGWEIANSSGTFRATLRPSTPAIEVVAGSLTVGNLYMGTMTFDDTTLRLYLNGVQVGSSTGAEMTLNSTQALTIGKGYAGTFFNGRISIVAIYNRALTATEVLQNYNAHKKRFL